MKLFSKRETGSHYEQLAKRHLCNHGVRFIAQNFSARCGELDLIMQDGNCLVFVEVKYRNNSRFGQAAEFVDRKKATRMLRTAHTWLRQQGLSAHTTEFRFDVVGIQNNGQDINWIKNAITEG